jgi:hypothetical protein
VVDQTVGPLTLNYVEKMIGQKERLLKKGGKQEAAFTDDGFALGLVISHFVVLLTSISYSSVSLYRHTY